MNNQPIRNVITVVLALVALSIGLKAIPRTIPELLLLATAVVGLGSYANSTLRNLVVSKISFVGQPRQALWLASVVGVAALTSLYGFLMALIVSAAVFFYTNRAEFDTVKTAAQQAAANAQSRLNRP